MRIDESALASLDIGATPFSRRGSYFAVSRIATAELAGVFLRTVRGDARNREILRLDLGDDATPLRTTVRAGALRLATAATSLTLALQGTGRAVLRLDRGAVVLRFRSISQYDAVLPEAAGVWRFIDSGANRNYRIVVGGGATLEAEWDGVRNRDAALRISADDGPVTIDIREYGSAIDPSAGPDLAAVEDEARADFAAWASRHASGPSGTAPSPAATLAAFVTWGALVPAGGLLHRESMLMSKNGMTNIWSWDHCFNALALHRDPDAAADQLLTLFDHQDEHGCLPDYVNDAGVERNFVKPPVHGWAIGWLMDRGGLADQVVADLYQPLADWTEWWFAHRDYAGDGIPSYNHGNDSGWDNATAFTSGVPLQSPDLLAYLVLQLRVLARIAGRTGRADEARSWERRAAQARDRMLAAFWRDGAFVARLTVTGEPVPSDSLLMLMPLVLGELLPGEVFEAGVARLRDGGFLTRHGLASEATTSPWYEADGYWRGPVWAPTIMLLVDGLARGGATGLADDIRRRFLATCAAGGMAENFDALTGAGLRDRSLTWTASVYLALQHEVVRAAADA